MSDWTEEQALEVLNDGNSLVVVVRGYEGRDTYVDDVTNGIYEVWLDEEGYDKPIAYLPWGAFEVTGFNINIGYGEHAEEIADAFVSAGAEDERKVRRFVN